MEIPKDILSTAVAVVDRGYDTGLLDAVAAALMAERERCAKVAEAEYPRVNEGSQTPNEYAIGKVAMRIASVIRTPSTGEEQSGGGTGPY